MAVWSAPGFLFLPTSCDSTRSRLHRPRPQEDASASPAAGTSRHAQVGGAVPRRGAGRDGDPSVGLGVSGPWPSGGVMGCAETCPSTLLLHSCYRAGHPGTAAGTSLAPSGCAGVPGTATRPGSAPSPGARRPIPLLPAPCPCPGPRSSPSRRARLPLPWL